MTRRTLSQTKNGSVVAWDETPEERAKRHEEAAREARTRFRLTPGQRRMLARRRTA